MMEGAVKLIIKAPNQQIKDQVVNCDIGWTIGRLKEHLTEVYPSKPDSTNQKLIYSGQLLNDSTCLKDVLRQCDGIDDQTYIIHLVSTSKVSSANKTTEKVQTATVTNPVPVTRSTMESARSDGVQTPNQDNTRTTTEPSHTQLYSTQYFDPHNNQQVAWMQQAYTHYFTQYMQLLAAQGIQIQSTTPYAQQLNINTNDNAQNMYTNNNNNNNNNNIGDDQAQQGVQDVVDANAGNINGDDGAFNRDWLDFFYVLSRIVVLFSIVYFYSSPLRFLIVTFLGFAIYLYQGGFLRVQPVLLPENNNVRADNNNQVQNEAGGAQAVPQQQNGQVPTVQTEARTNVNEEHEEERPGALAFTWTFFSSFFASLIPDQQNVL